MVDMRVMGWHRCSWETVAEWIRELRSVFFTLANVRKWGQAPWSGQRRLWAERVLGVDIDRQARQSEPRTFTALSP
jgi:hypothetical protein